MSDSIYLLQGGTLVEVRQEAYAHEVDLQELVAGHPELLPGALIDPDKPRRWILVKREAGVPMEEAGGDWWSLDHLPLDQDGVPTFVEVKRATDARIRREVVAQMLEYAANATVYWKADRLRGWFEESASAESAQALRQVFADEEFDAEVFWAKVQSNLETSRVRLIFVADEIPAMLRRLVEFLNEQLERIEVLAVELPQYVNDDGLKVIAPRLIGQTEKARAIKGSGLRPRLGRSEVHGGSSRDARRVGGASLSSTSGGFIHSPKRRYGGS